MNICLGHLPNGFYSPRLGRCTGPEHMEVDETVAVGGRGKNKKSRGKQSVMGKAEGREEMPPRSELCGRLCPSGAAAAAPARAAGVPPRALSSVSCRRPTALAMEVHMMLKLPKFFGEFCGQGRIAWRIPVADPGPRGGPGQDWVLQKKEHQRNQGREVRKGVIRDADLTDDEMHQLISLNRKMGNHGHAAALQQRLDKRKAGSAPIPIQVQANQSDRARKALEKKLSNELEQFEKWQTWLADKKNSIHSLHQQLVEENDRYKKLVAQLQAEVAPPSSPPSSASLSLQDLLDGKQLFDATSVESFFNVDPEVYELGEEDRKQMAARAEDLSKRLVETTQNLFGAAAKQLEEARQLHKSHVSGLAKRRKAEGAAMPGLDQPILFASVYMHHSEGLTDRNLDILGKVGSAAEVYASECLVAADFNMSPDLVQDSGFTERLHGNLIIPQGEGTCLTTGGIKMLDYFVATSGVSKACGRRSQMLLEIPSEFASDLDRYQALVKSIHSFVSIVAAPGGRLCVEDEAHQEHLSHIVGELDAAIVHEQSDERGSIRSLTCEALWTRDRAIKVGYRGLEDRCELCGFTGDSTFHRLWRCPAVASTRGETVSQSLIDEAADADLADPEVALLFTRGVFPHPGDVFPRPSREFLDCEFQARCEWVEPPQDGGTFDGDIFLDGSCFRHEIAELSRAGYGLVKVDSSGDRVCHIYEPIHAPFLQTSQCAEFAALARGGVEVMSDASQGPVAEIGEDRHPGQEQPRLSTFYSDCLNAEESRLQWQIKIAKAVCKLAAKLLPAWPPLDLTDCYWEHGTRRGAGPRVAAAMDGRPGLGERVLVRASGRFATVLTDDGSEVPFKVQFEDQELPTVDWIGLQDLDRWDAPAADARADLPEVTEAVGLLHSPALSIAEFFGPSANGDARLAPA
ncbi:unnamed protein product [Prorocentrum cordatum]|uniref:Uncharacterized protein n=1 Tax=Prorocentrum cordatum TaxID=2364126 RepID=A0ABN9R818_9DINO|nr:unnamed protein product [Polarella glacialis]